LVASEGSGLVPLSEKWGFCMFFNEEAGGEFVLILRGRVQVKERWTYLVGGPFGLQTGAPHYLQQTRD